MNLENAEDTKCWIIAFEAHCRGYAIQDKPEKDGTFEKRNKFLEKCGTKCIAKVMSFFPDKNIEELPFSDIKAKILSYISPKERLTIADRANFLQLSQKP